FILPKNGQIYKRFLKFFARGGEICLLFLRLQKDFRKQRKKCEHIFLAKDNNVHFFVTGQRNEPKKTRIGALPLCTPLLPSASESNCHGCAMGNSKARTEPQVRLTSAFAASKRTAKNEKLTRIGIEALLVLLGGNVLRFEPHERGYGVCGFLRGLMFFPRDGPPRTSVPTKFVVFSVEQNRINFSQ
ncbi:MAG: hypothetical protein IJW97_07815, partial [Clostridia bacterium]|nr:hypothetical protein [Clostridia bacterium]